MSGRDCKLPAEYEVIYNIYQRGLLLSSLAQSLYADLCADPKLRLTPADLQFIQDAKNCIEQSITSVRQIKPFRGEEVYPPIIPPEVSEEEAEQIISPAIALPLAPPEVEFEEEYKPAVIGRPAFVPLERPPCDNMQPSSMYENGFVDPNYPDVHWCKCSETQRILAPTEHKMYLPKSSRTRYHAIENNFHYPESKYKTNHVNYSSGKHSRSHLGNDQFYSKNRQYESNTHSSRYQTRDNYKQKRRSFDSDDYLNSD